MNAFMSLTNKHSSFDVSMKKFAEECGICYYDNNKFLFDVNILARFLPLPKLELTEFFCDYLKQYYDIQ